MGVGAMLSQLDDDVIHHLVVYFSTSYFQGNRKYSTIEKECLAIKIGT